MYHSLMRLVCLALILALTVPSAFARGHSANYCYWCEHTPSGHIERSQVARIEFKKSHPCPSTGRSSGACPGYVIDHVKALKRGGADDPSNMQWQTKEDGKAKDKWA
jgi:hypothetical protein